MSEYRSIVKIAKADATLEIVDQLRIDQTNELVTTRLRHTAGDGTEQYVWGFRPGKFAAGDRQVRLYALGGNPNAFKALGYIDLRRLDSVKTAIRGVLPANYVLSQNKHDAYQPRTRLILSALAGEDFAPDPDTGIMAADAALAMPAELAGDAPPALLFSDSGLNSQLDDSLFAEHWARREDENETEETDVAGGTFTRIEAVWILRSHESLRTKAAFIDDKGRQFSISAVEQDFDRRQTRVTVTRDERGN